MSIAPKTAYRRILLKLSGEALMTVNSVLMRKFSTEWHKKLKN